jgi:FKBP-type peptidyl-prolyl cis-trans isomerase FklB
MLRTFSAVVLASTFVLTGCNGSNISQEDSAKIDLDTDYKKLSYGLGLNIGAGISQQGVPELDMRALLAGIRESVGGKEPRLSQEELKQTIGRVQQLEAEKQQLLADQNIDSGSVFLAANSERDGVISTESGLQYEVLTAGEGDKPSAESLVTTHYHGTLIDGRVFDSSVERGEPIEFAVNQVIPGWTEALQLMSTGSKWRLYVPANLAYGEYSPSADIPPHSALIFEVELLSFKEPAPFPEPSFTQ